VLYIGDPKANKTTINISIVSLAKVRQNIFKAKLTFGQTSFISNVLVSQTNRLLHLKKDLEHQAKSADDKLGTAK